MLSLFRTEHFTFESESDLKTSRKRLEKTLKTAKIKSRISLSNNTITAQGTRDSLLAHHVRARLHEKNGRTVFTGRYGLRRSVEAFFVACMALMLLLAVHIVLQKSFVGLMAFATVVFGLPALQRVRFAHEHHLCAETKKLIATAVENT